MVEPSILVTKESDELHFQADSAIKKTFAADEYILMSCLVYKYNKRLKRQERCLLITSKAIYNINKQDFFANFMSVFNSSFAIRRKIDVAKIAAISVSEISSEFVLHVRDEYDYRYGSVDQKDKILLKICQAYYLNVRNRPLTFFFKDEVNLIDYTTTEDDKKNGMIRMPKDNPMLMDEFALLRKIEEGAKKKEDERNKTVPVFMNTSMGVKVTLDDFEILKVLGRGAFGKVVLALRKETKQLYAIKSMHKEHIIGKDQLEHTKTERYVLEKSKCPFLVTLEFAFQTPNKVFFVMKFMRGGELFQHLRDARRFDEDRAKFYAAEIVLGIEYLHSIGVVYRDLKPENVLMDDNGHLVLTDFGMAKQLKDGELTHSFVGTPEYLASEIVKGEGHGKPVDWWALGILVYEMIAGLPPFYNKDHNTQKMFASIREKEVTFSSKYVISNEAKDFIQRLLKKKPEERLGFKGAQEVKGHKWFQDINWKLMSEKKVTPPFKPSIDGELDLKNFDKLFTGEDPKNTFTQTTNMKLVSKHDKEFNGFTFVGQQAQLHDQK